MAGWLPALAVTGAIVCAVRAVVVSEENRVRAGVWCVALMWTEWLVMDRLLVNLHG